MTTDKLKHIISVLWAKGLPFAAWQLPGQKEVYLIIQLTETVQLIDFKDIESVKGFIIAPFESAHTGKAYVLQPELSSDSLQGIDVEQLPDFRKDKRTESILNEVWDKEVYLEKARQLIADLKSRKLKKLVLSRVIEKRLQKEMDPGLMFTLLNEKYTDSFNYICYLPEVGSWIGASPELFLKVDDTYTETVSLAGTKPFGKIHWTPKETEEQAIVTEFITSRLDELGVKNYEVHGPETVLAGKVGHLATRIRIPAEEVRNKTGKLVSHLHPTPAVCGMPQREAFEYILKTEDHKRKCYTGFIGPWQLQGCSELYVNLRCAEFDKKTVHVFVGGGLTASSVAESEWEETEHKSKTLLSVIEKLGHLPHDFR